MNTKTLRKKAKDGSLEVEDLLQAAIAGQPGLPEELARLTAEYGWQRHGLQPDGTRIVPFAAWAEVASAYASGGIAALRALVQEPENIPFVLGLLEGLHTNESVALVLEIYGENLTNPAHATDLALQIASTFNLLLSFKPAAPVTTHQAAAIQDFLFALYPLAQSPAERTTVLLALRGVGDSNAIRFVEAAADFPEPWQDTKKSVLRALRKRVKKNAL